MAPLEMSDSPGPEPVANILLVDDDPENLWALQMALASEGHRVSIAGDVSRALSVLRREPIELIVMDCQMPDLDGVELCRLVRAQPAHRDLPIVMLSGDHEPVGSVRCWTCFLRKPTSICHLVAVIDAYVVPRLPVARRAVPRASMQAALKCQHPSFSRWTSMKGDYWPDL
jgi:DNA-binding response OmpR family regulator